MKIKSIYGIVLGLAVLFLSGCSVDTDPARTEQMLAYSQAVNMKVTPEDYIGQIRTLRGQSTSEYFAVTGKTYYSLLIPNADGSYTEKIEYLLADGDYPGDGCEVTVTGAFDVYQENGIPYCRLANAKIISK